MVEFITKGYEPRNKTETQVENNSRQTAMLSGQMRASQKKKLPEFQHYFIFSYLSGASKEGEKRRGAFRCKRDEYGYALFKASHVQDFKYNFSSHSEFCFLKPR